MPFGDSECGVKPPGKNVHRPAVGVVSGVGDELIVEADFRRGGNRVAVVSLDDLLQPGMRQLAVAHDDAQAAGIEIRYVGVRNAVDDTGNSYRVIRPAPLLAVDGNA